MALSTKVTSFIWNQADGAGTNYDVTLGFQPKMVRLTISGNASATDAVGRDSIGAGVGFGVSSSDRISNVFAAADGVGNASYFVRHSGAAILSIPDTVSPGGSDSDGDLDIAAEAGWPADGIRFTVDEQLVAAIGSLRVMVEAWGGDDITEAKTLSFQEPGATGDQTVAHGLGGTPTGVLLASVGLGSAPPVDSGSQGMFMLGASDGTRSGVVFMGGDDGNTNMDTTAYGKMSEVIALGPEPAVTIDARATVSSFDATNITFNWSERAATRYIHGLVWRGTAQFKVDSLTTRTDTTQFDGPTNGFVSKLSSFHSVCRAESTADTPTAHGQMSMGAATSASERIAHAVLDEDALATSECSTAIEYDEVYANISTSSAIQGLMDVVDLTVDPIQVVMDDADPAGSLVIVASWGEAAAATKAKPLFRQPTRFFRRSA